MMDADEDELALLMAQACSLTAPCDAPDKPGQCVDLDETRAQVNLGRKGEDSTWYLDTGASNHMTGCAELFSELDTTMHDTVKF